MKTQKNYCICKCGHKHCIDYREINLYQGLTQALAKIYKWCVENDRNEFSRKEIINHNFLGPSEYSTWASWTRFSGLVYRTKVGHYGINLERCEKFFSGASVIYTKVLIDPVTKKIVDRREAKHESEIPGLHKFLDENGLYNANYVPRNLFVKEEDGDVDLIVI